MVGPTGVPSPSAGVMLAGERLELGESGDAAVRAPDASSEMENVALEVIAGWGLIVRLPPPLHRPVRPLCMWAYLLCLLQRALMACACGVVARQGRVKNCRTNTIPAVLTVDQIDFVETPAVFSLSHPNVLYYGNENCVTPEAKALWSVVNKDALPDPLFSPVYPRNAGSKLPWQHLKDALVAEHNNGKLPEGVLVKKWPEVGGLKVWPPLKMLASNFTAVQGVHPCFLHSLLHFILNPHSCTIPVTFLFAHFVSPSLPCQILRRCRR